MSEFDEQLKDHLHKYHLRYLQQDAEIVRLSTECGVMVEALKDIIDGNADGCGDCGYNEGIAAKALARVSGTQK